MPMHDPMGQYGMSRYDVREGRVRDQEGAFQRRSGNQARDEARAAKRETVSPTFSELQSQGRARPPMNATLQSALTSSGMANAESDGPAMSPASGGDSRLDSIIANLEAQFAGQRSRLNEDLARRGIYSSSGELGAGARLGDLEGQQSRAIAQASTEYGMMQDERYDALMRMLLPILLGG